MKKQFWIVVLLFGMIASATAQVSLRISQIQTATGSSPYLNQTVKTFGVVTAKFQNTGEIGGFFIQDTVRNDNDSVSDGIYVYNRTFNTLDIGDLVEVTGTVAEYKGMTELSTVTAVDKKASNYALPFITMKFPAEWTDWKRLGGMLVRFDQRLVVNTNNTIRTDGKIGLSSVRRRAETEQFIRKDNETELYDSLMTYNRRDYVPLGNGQSGTPNTIPFLDDMDISRTGQGIDTLWAVVYQTSASQYILLPAKMPEINGNPRPTIPDDQKLGDFTLKICAYNLENYYGSGITANKTKKIVKGLMAIDADVFGFCETQQGDQTVNALVSALNTALGKDVYANYAFNLTNNANYSGVSVIYKKNKVKPNRTPYYINNPTPMYRKFFVSFEEIASSEKFIISINHLKSKSGIGTGNDADKGDGQSNFNATRVNEVNAVMNYYNSTAQTRYGTERMIIMGDLNALANEDPVRILKNAGFANQNERFSNDEYSYVYEGRIQYLDYVMTNDSLSKYVTGAVVFHINSDELKVYQQDTTMYHCSDHDPVIVGLNFGAARPPTSLAKQKIETFTLFPNPSHGYLQIVSEKTKFSIIQVFDITGREVYSETLCKATNRHDITLHSTLKGYHVVRLITENGQILMQKCLLTP